MQQTTRWSATYREPDIAVSAAVDPCAAIAWCSLLLLAEPVRSAARGSGPQSAVEALAVKPGTWAGLRKVAIVLTSFRAQTPLDGADTSFWLAASPEVGRGARWRGLVGRWGIGQAACWLTDCKLSCSLS